MEPEAIESGALKASCQGQRLDVTFTNHGSMPHSLDFHSARVAASAAFKDVPPGETLRFSFVAQRPGVYLYHCVTAPAVALPTPMPRIRDCSFAVDRWAFAMLVLSSE